ncbi:AraC family transcriptional regulator [Maribellus sp. YY47]|uniref:helix-turn-helix domain-containing protein n=1 Tax=Maribellus sp. YY47 TaxID=2929486 RepID=UPI002001A160|nr:AraC family transcriptional regulator [Maribellus sp. YY47]MCK3685372.1 AraC family transcriptional regulator [Maribellus sp. YY47]
MLGDSHLKLLRTKLLSLFEEEKIYRLSDLRITTVSETLQTNRTYISRLINEEFGVNFNEFVNKYRVEEAEALLKNEDNALYTLDYIAEKAGFGSTNSFTRAFKEYKGITPGTFRNKLTEA